MSVEYYPQPRTGLLAYAVVDGCARRQGLSSALWAVAVPALCELSQGDVRVVFAETHARSDAAMEQEAVQNYVRDRYHRGDDLDEHILANIRDIARREALVARMAEHALPAEVPHFVEHDPLNEIP